MARMRGVAGGSALLTMMMACGVSGQKSTSTAAAVSNREGPATPTTSVVCLATIDGTVRMYRLHKQHTWMLTMANPAAANAPVELSLPGAEPALLATNAKLTYRGYGGALAFSLDSSASGASLDLRVDANVPDEAARAIPEGVIRYATAAALAIPPCRIVPP